MSDSALSLRDQRKLGTVRALTAIARRMTRERDFTGFTVEELCEEAGVSRRTFFNYFASKEDALYGFALIDPEQQQLEHRFLASSGDPIDDFTALQIARWDQQDPIAHAAGVFELIEHDPRLARGAFERLAASEQRDVELVARRMGDRARSEIIVHIVGSLLRLCFEDLLHRRTDTPFRTLLTARLALAREVLHPEKREG